jgi:hypothetical protein
MFTASHIRAKAVDDWNVDHDGWKCIFVHDKGVAVGTIRRISVCRIVGLSDMPTRKGCVLMSRNTQALLMSSRYLATSSYACSSLNFMCIVGL